MAVCGQGPFNVRVRQELAKGTVSASESEPEPILLERGRLVMDPARHKVLWDGKDVTLTVTEFMYPARTPRMRSKSWRHLSRSGLARNRAS